MNLKAPNNKQSYNNCILKMNLKAPNSKQSYNNCSLRMNFKAPNNKQSYNNCSLRMNFKAPNNKQSYKNCSLRMKFKRPTTNWTNPFYIDTSVKVCEGMLTRHSISYTGEHLIQSRLSSFTTPSLQCHYIDISFIGSWIYIIVIRIL